MDTITPEQRSKVMAKIRSTDTSTELAARRLIHGMGYRYRLHRSDLPGTPDIVFPSRRAVIFVHGCFWHHHENCKIAHQPKSRSEFWQVKFERNKARDKRNVEELRHQGWRVMIIWECELTDPASLMTNLTAFLELDATTSGDNKIPTGM